MYAMARNDTSLSSVCSSPICISAPSSHCIRAIFAMNVPAASLLALAFSHGVHGIDYVSSLALGVVTPVTVPGGTKTNVWSTTLTATTFIPFINPRRVELITTETVTSLEPPWASPSLPATVTETVISNVTWEDRVTYLEKGETSTSVTSFIATVHDTWLVHKPQKTDLPAGSISTGSAACGSEASIGGCDGGPPDPVCKEEGLMTACQGQCQPRKGDGDDSGNFLWWCYMLRQREYSYPELRMGRACWGGNLEYRQLNTPCVTGDVAVACVPCQGVNSSWAGLNWKGPEAGE